MPDWIRTSTGRRPRSTNTDFVLPTIGALVFIYLVWPLIGELVKWLGY